MAQGENKNNYPVYSKTHRSGNRSWVVCVGSVNGKRQFRAFQSIEEAQHFRAECLETERNNKPEAFCDLTELARASYRRDVERLRPYNSTVSEAVDFFIKFAKPPKGKVTIQEAMDLFEEGKRRRNLSNKYIDTAKRCFFAPFRDFFRNSLINEITPPQVEDYLHHNKDWSVTTRNTHNRHLRALYSFLIKRGNATFNPLLSVEFATEPSKACQKVMPPEDVKTLLQYALNEKKYGRECASMVLVFFCGVRVDEVERLDWAQVSLNGGESTVRIEESKEGQRRVNTIAANAVEWLKVCRGEGRVAPPNYEKRMQRLRKRAGVNYPQNAGRHCFASYHIAFHRNGAETACLLGHPNPALLYRTYRALVSYEDAKEYWNILPDSVLQERDNAQRARAEEESMIGQAYRDRSGKWAPLKPIFDPDLLDGIDECAATRSPSLAVASL